LVADSEHLPHNTAQQRNLFVAVQALSSDHKRPNAGVHNGLDLELILADSLIFRD